MAFERGVRYYTTIGVHINLTFPEDRVCCAWCNYKFVNKSGHTQCSLTGEEIFRPEQYIGNRCPGRDGTIIEKDEGGA